MNSFNEKKYIELCTKREMVMYDLRMKGVQYEERCNAVQKITDEINELTGHKEIEPPDDEWHPAYEIVGANGYEGVPTVFQVNGKNKYYRILIQKRWIERCIDKDNDIYECIVPIENLKYFKK